MQFDFVAENQSTLTDAAHGGALDVGALEMLVWAGQYMLIGCGDQKPQVTVCDEYGGRATVRVGTADPAKGEIAVIIRDDYPSQPGAGGWHTDENGRPAVFVSRQYSSSLLTGAFSLSELFTHEITEALADAGANRKATRLGGLIDEAFEPGDRCEGDVWTTPNGVDVCNWLLSSAFLPGAPGPWDFKGTLKGQYDKTPNGYAIRWKAGSPLPDQAEIEGTPHPSQMGRIRSPYSRVQRRFRGLTRERI
ncbi:MAG TPA: hypothetical protein VKR78_07580 [Acidimicrobiales bacterium]|nr:hypothetical protein [Acidimicrobiales bacterium]